MRAGKRIRLWIWPASLVVVVAATLVMHRIAFAGRGVSEFLWLFYADIPNAAIVHDVRPPIVIAFILTAISFVTLGQIIGERLQDFSRAALPLGGYIADLGGSLIGVIAFAVASFYRTFPVTWFVVILIAGALLIALRDTRALIAHAVFATAIVAAIGATEQSTVYSPYYALRARHNPSGKGINVLVNGSFHQYAAPIMKRDAGASEYDRVLQRTYPIPYQQLSSKPRNVLVLGAGTGNDVAVALDHGAERIDAVEIDPVIIEIGRSLHPDRPYQSPRVHVFNTDARAYLRNTIERYDLIIFGTLDSQTRLSALANVRLDNFVYTVDCMRMARERLAPGGGMALYFSVHNEAIHEKIFAMLTDAFGEPPLVLHGFKLLFTELFLAGPAWEYLRTPLQRVELSRALQATASVDIPTDDWPYLYLDSRKISSQMSLLWGATWTTSAVVFASILLMILLGTILMQYRPMPSPVATAALTITLLLTYAIPTEWLLARTPAARLGLSIFFAGAPVFFASICFALLFRQRTEVNLAFGWNLAGAVVGGLIEILAVTIGLRALTLVAAAAYLSAFLLKRGGELRAASPPRVRS